MISRSASQVATGLPINGEPASDVVAALRAATVERHRTIDRSMPLSRPNPQLTDYVEHLRIMRTWLQPLECWLGGSAILQTSLIDADLVEAGVPERANAANGTSGRPVDATASYRWGARYVIEGSRLGAAVLYRRLSHALRPHKLRYLQDGTGISPDRWPNFLRELRASVKTPAEIEQACQGACASFDALIAICPSESEHS